MRHELPIPLGIVLRLYSAIYSLTSSPVRLTWVSSASPKAAYVLCFQPVSLTIDSRIKLSGYCDMLFHIRHLNTVRRKMIPVAGITAGIDIQSARLAIRIPRVRVERLTAV
jgi:hypothetical protein